MRAVYPTSPYGFRGMAIPLAVAFLLLCSLCGCGGEKGGEGPKPLTPQEEVVDGFLRGLVSEDGEALLSALPPASVEAILRDLTTLSREELGTILLKALRPRFPYTRIEDIHYRTEERGEGSAAVFYWGTFEMTGDDGNSLSREIPEEKARDFPLLLLDDRWYMDVWTR